MGSPEVSESVAEVVARARAAQAAINDYTAEQVDELTTAVAWAVGRKDRAEELARLAVDEAGFGNYGDKVIKIEKRVFGVLSDLRRTPTVGVVAQDDERGITEIAKPVGVVAALIPTTGPDATPPVKALCALAGRNAVVFAAHPRSKQTTAAVVEYMREACEQVGAPADLTDAADSIKLAKTFDYATSCLADNAVVAHTDVYDELLTMLQDRGGHLCDPQQKQQLQAAMWPDGGHIPTMDVIAKSAGHIAELAGFPVGPEVSFLIVEEDGAGPEHPFSGEKLSVVLALYRYTGGIDGAVDVVNDITNYQGLGHTCGIHTSDESHIEALAAGTRTARVMVNQNLNEGAGSPRNGLPFTLSLSCGTWGGTIMTENVNARHFVNITRVSRPITPTPMDEEVLFGRHFERHGR